MDSKTTEICGGAAGNSRRTGPLTGYGNSNINNNDSSLWPPGKSEKEHVEYHKDGSVWAKGKRTDGVPTGYWEWFRKDGTKLRSGHFQKGEQVGEWITYDKNGQKYKVTKIKPKTRKRA